MPPVRLAIAIAVLCLSKTVIVESTSAFLIIDVQNGFLPGGSLAVAHGNEIVPIINGLRSSYEGSMWNTVALSRDWHCWNHVSFASTNQVPAYSTKTLRYTAEKKLCYDGVIENRCSGWCEYTINCTGLDIAYTIDQMMWPDHCVMNTESANFSSSLTVLDTDYIQRKGWHCQVDAYSAFASVDSMYTLELGNHLRSLGVTRVFVAGLATDYCVKWSSISAANDGFDTYMISDASRGIAPDLSPAYAEMEAAGVRVINTTSLASLPTDAELRASSDGTGWGTSAVVALVIGSVVGCALVVAYAVLSMQSTTKPATVAKATVVTTNAV